jgi:hypothetical protein
MISLITEKRANGRENDKQEENQKETTNSFQ